MNTRIILKSLDDLEQFNFIIVDGDKKVKNNISKVLKEKNMVQADLCKLTGISRQNISAIVNDKLLPRIVFALQIAKVLDTPVEKLFELTPNAWIKLSKIEQDKTLYIDLYKLEIIDSTLKKEQIKNDNLEYLDLKNNKCISKKEYEVLFNKFIEEKSPNTLNKRLSWDDKILINEEFEKLYTKRYKKLAQKININ